MKKLKEIIERSYDYGVLPKGITPYMMCILCDIYNELADGKSASFIEKEINNLLNQCGIPTRPCGIGWEAGL